MKTKLFYHLSQISLVALVLLMPFASINSLENTEADDTTSQLFFRNLYATSFKSPEEADEAFNKNPDTDTLLSYANFYYTTGSLMGPGNSTGLDYVEKSFQTYHILWKKNFSNPRIQLLMANAYASQGANPRINIKTVIEYVFRARNLYSMIIDRYSRNMEARLGRARINMNLNDATGRQTGLHKTDIEVYISGYDKLPHEEQNNLYYKMGLMEMYLARAMLEVESKNILQATEDLARIDTALLHYQAKKLYESTNKAIQNSKGEKK